LRTLLKKFVDGKKYLTNTQRATASMMQLIDLVFWPISMPVGPFLLSVGLVRPELDTSSGSFVDFKTMGK